MQGRTEARTLEPLEGDIVGGNGRPSELQKLNHVELRQVARVSPFDVVVDHGVAVLVCAVTVRDSQHDRLTDDVIAEVLFGRVRNVDVEVMSIASQN